VAGTAPERRQILKITRHLRLARGSAVAYSCHYSSRSRER
jgi:hypothetical protein